MDVRSKGLMLLRDTESTLRDLMRQAADAGDYISIVALASWAQAIGDLTRMNSPARESHESQLAKPVQPRKRPSIVAENGKAKAISRNAAKTFTDAGYPQFFQRGGQLVKVGWSRRLREEYQHKASQRAVDLVVAAILAAGKGGELFTPEQFLPVTDTVDRCDVPVYQVYVILAWLKDVGLVETHGRSGYTLTAERELISAVKVAWAKLGQRN